MNFFKIVNWYKIVAKKIIACKLDIYVRIIVGGMIGYGIIYFTNPIFYILCAIFIPFIFDIDDDDDYNYLIGSLIMFAIMFAIIL